MQKEQRKIVKEKDRKKKVLDMCIMTGRAQYTARMKKVFFFLLKAEQTSEVLLAA